MVKRAKFCPRQNMLFRCLATLPTHCLTSLHFLKILYFVSTLQILDLNFQSSNASYCFKKVDKKRTENMNEQYSFGDEIVCRQDSHFFSRNFVSLVADYEP